MRHVTRSLLAVSLVSGCALTERDLLFPGAIEGVPAVVHLGELTPIAPVDADEIADSVIYGEVGPTGDTTFGGVTFSFVGNGRDVCVWLDPELVSWSQAVSPTGPSPEYEFPDNIFDDGDLDVSAGLSVYYSGVPGESVGTFRVDYVDGLGNVVPIDLLECVISSERFPGVPSHSGRGMPEYCTIANTIQGLSYTVLMETYSVPLDDDRLSYGLVLAEGNCEELVLAANNGGDPVAVQSNSEECLIKGEAVQPGSATGEDAAAAGLPSPSWIGGEVPSWPGSINVEEFFCYGGLGDYCREEARQVRRGELNCSWHLQPGEGGDRCYCGNELNTPGAGAN